MGQVGVAGFQRCSQTLTGRAAVTAELAVGEQLAESPDVVVVLEGQTVTFQAEENFGELLGRSLSKRRNVSSSQASDRASSMVRGLSLSSRSLLSRSLIASMKCWTANLSECQGTNPDKRELT